MRTLFVCLFEIFLIAGCSIKSHKASLSSDKKEQLVLQNITVVNVKTGSLLENRTVVVQGNRILEINRSGNVNLSGDEQIIDGTGKYVIPGLWNMHVHTFYKGAPELYFPLQVANGVTSIRDMNGPMPPEKINQLKDSISSGELLGPYPVYAPGPLIDGPRPAEARGESVISVSTESEAREAVRNLNKKGADFIKIYNRITPDLLAAIAAASRNNGIDFVGHIPHLVRALDASEVGIKSIEHLSGVLEGCADNEEELIALTEEIINDPASARHKMEQFIEMRKKVVSSFNPYKAEKLFQTFSKNETWQTPTLVSNYVLSLSLNDSILTNHPYLKFYSDETLKNWKQNSSGRQLQHQIMSERFPKLLAVLHQMHNEGIKFLAGTDLGAPFIFPGYSLHKELEFFVEAGFSPLEALQTATLNPAQFFQIEDSLGTVDEGKIANLVILDENPLKDIRNTRTIHSVILNGNYLNRTKLDSLLKINTSFR